MGKTYKDAKDNSKLASKYKAYQRKKKNKVKHSNKNYGDKNYE